MKIWAASETDGVSGPSVERIRKLVEPYLNSAFEKSALRSLDAKIRYVPIVMPPAMRVSYPPRSKLRRAQRLYDCAPQLAYDVFVQGSFGEQVREYVTGIEVPTKALIALGASIDQARVFRALLAEAIGAVSE